MTPPFDEKSICARFGAGDSYASPPPNPGRLARHFPSLYYYVRLLGGPVRWLFRKAAKGQCDDPSWVRSSAWCADILEDAGCRFEIAGMDYLREPCVIVANHMSTLETFILPALIRPRLPLTFVVKESLVRMPLFGPVMRSRDPVVVGRRNPREDLVAMLREGAKRLADGISVVVFPQSTRSVDFDKKHFNSIGEKLAARANVPLLPLALKTDAWGQGAKIKEAGKIRPDLPVRFRFGAPMRIEGNDKAQHEAAASFIAETLSAWQQSDGINRPNS